ncbi:hypothetical protein ROZALSC1DRAFT_25178, partial [Rozella allomycis CSF55]
YDLDIHSKSYPAAATWNIDLRGGYVETENVTDEDNLERCFYHTTLTNNAAADSVAFKDPSPHLHIQDKYSMDSEIETAKIARQLEHCQNLLWVQLGLVEDDYVPPNYRIGAELISQHSYESDYNEREIPSGSSFVILMMELLDIAKGIYEEIFDTACKQRESKAIVIRFVPSYKHRRTDPMLDWTILEHQSKNYVYPMLCEVYNNEQYVKAFFHFDLVLPLNCISKEHIPIDAPSDQDLDELYSLLTKEIKGLFSNNNYTILTAHRKPSWVSKGWKVSFRFYCRGLKTTAKGMARMHDHLAGYIIPPNLDTWLLCLWKQGTKTQFGWIWKVDETDEVAVFKITRTEEKTVIFSKGPNIIRHNDVHQINNGQLNELLDIPKSIRWKMEKEDNESFKLATDDPSYRVCLVDCKTRHSSYSCFSHSGGRIDKAREKRILNVFESIVLKRSNTETKRKPFVVLVEHMEDCENGYVRVQGTGEVYKWIYLLSNS